MLGKHFSNSQNKKNDPKPEQTGLLITKMEKNQLIDATQCALGFLEKYSGKGSTTKPYQAFKALTDLTQSDLNEGKSPDQCRYTVYELFSEITGMDSYQKETERKNVNRYLKELEKKLPSHESMLLQIANENNLSAIPGYSFKEGEGNGAGNYSMHFISPRTLTMEETKSQTQKQPESGIKYYLESIENLPFWIRWLNNFELSEWRLKFIAILMLLILAAGVFLYLIFFGVFINPGSTGLDILRPFVATTSLCIVIFWPFRLIYLCVTKRIIPAPALILPYSVSNAQIECVATDKIRKSTGRPVRKFQLVSYASKCPLCNKRIEVESGGREFNNRLIGRCLEVPDEHVFSFDRVLRVGSPLR